MELVCRETRRPFTWFYDTEDQLYIRKDKRNCENARIRGCNLPNPADILEGRKRAITTGQLPFGARIEADPVIKKLWEHYNANYNDKFQS